jgi:hypothetical protein
MGGVTIPYCRISRFYPPPADTSKTAPTMMLEMNLQTEGTIVKLPCAKSDSMQSISSLLSLIYGDHRLLTDGQRVGVDASCGDAPSPDVFREQVGGGGEKRRRTARGSPSRGRTKRKRAATARGGAPVDSSDEDEAQVEQTVADAAAVEAGAAAARGSDSHSARTHSPLRGCPLLTV